MRPTIVEITTNRGALGKGEYLGFERGVGLLRLTPAIDPNIVLRRANEAFEASLAEGFTWEDYEYVKRSPAAFFSPLRSVRSKAFASALINLLLPATEAAREAYRRQRCAFNLCEISLAAARYAAENGAPLPAFSVDVDGKPLHSWRVLILPYLELTPEEREFYGQIRLDEPWDSEFNAQFQAKAPAVFRCPSIKLDDPGETTYSVILGENSLFDESGAGRDPREIAKDPERDPFNQILVAERLAPVVWTRPDAELAEELAFAGV
ncbi:MAG: DUF1559 domain-containing protein, partial [Thermoguttaceae bacterium]|nr:DUF1559 domain-containing protein [Thermoguttaceae bacterium]